MKVAMFHSEGGGVGLYRIWQPAKYMKTPHTTFGTGKPPILPVSKPSKENSEEAIKNYEKYGSWEEIGNNHDIIVTQRTDEMKQIAILLGLRDTFKKPLVLEVDDDFMNIPPDHKAYPLYAPKHGDNYIVTPIDRSEVEKYNALIDSGQVSGSFLENENGLFFIEDKGINKRELVAQFASQVDAMTVTTPALKEVYSQFCDNIYILPNSIDFDIWDKVEKKTIDNGKIRIGWAGGIHHYSDLLSIWPVIRTLLDLYPNLEFHYMNLRPDFLEDHPQCIWHPGRHLEEYPQALADLDLHIGIAPVVKNQFNKGKSNLKWLEYSALGIPTVATDWDTYSSIRHAETGFKARSDKEWLQILKRLIADANLRNQVGKAAYQEIKKNYNAKTNAKLWDEAYEDIWKTHLGHQ